MEDERTVNVENDRNEVTAPGEWWQQVRSDLDRRMESLMAGRLQPLRQEVQQFQSLLQGLEERIERASQPVWQELDPAWRSMEEAVASERQRQVESHRAELSAAVEAAVEEVRKAAEARLVEMEERLRSSREVLGRTLRSLEEGSHLATALPQTVQEPERKGVEPDSIQFDSLRGAIESISLQTSQQEALLRLLDQVSDYAPRAIFFVVRGGNVLGWRARGFENGLTDGTVTSLRSSVESGSLLGEALRKQQAVALAHPTADQVEAVVGSHGGPLPTRAVALPLVVREKAVAVLYVDARTPQEEERIDQRAIEILLRVTALVIELLSTRKQLVSAAPKPSLSPTPEPAPAESTRAEEVAAAPAGKADPMPTGFTEPAPPTPAVPSPAAAEKTSPVSPTAPEGTPAWMAEAPTTTEPPDQRDETEHAVQAMPAEQAIQAEPGEEAEEEEVPVAVQEDSAARDKALLSPFVMSPEMGRITREIPAGEIPFLTEEPEELEKKEDEVRVHFPFAASPEPPRNEPGSGKVGDEGRSPVPEPPPPIHRPPVPPLAGRTQDAPPIVDEMEQRAHNDARRFARLLVSEIKLYNASKVQEGRRNLDLYERLAEEIDRSRQVYDKRVSPEVAMEVDYYHEELVQTLAEGDPAKLGVSYPGPALR